MVAAAEDAEVPEPGLARRRHALLSLAVYRVVHVEERGGRAHHRRTLEGEFGDRGHGAVVDREDTPDGFLVAGHVGQPLGDGAQVRRGVGVELEGHVPEEALGGRRIVKPSFERGREGVAEPSDGAWEGGAHDPLESRAHHVAIGQPTLGGPGEGLEVVRVRNASETHARDALLVRREVVRSEGHAAASSSAGRSPPGSPSTRV